MESVDLELLLLGLSIEELEDIMKFFDTVDEISRIFDDYKITPKTLPISVEIEKLVSNCC